jgi:hypothetical protein
MKVAREPEWIGIPDPTLFSRVSQRWHDLSDPLTVTRPWSTTAIWLMIWATALLCFLGGVAVTWIMLRSKGGTG